MVGPDGFPLSWHHYAIGLRAIGRARAQYKLDTFAAVGIVHTKKEDFDQWILEQKIAAGLINGGRKRPS